MKEILINTENKEQIEFVRRFLSDFRNENYKRFKNGGLEFQAFSNVIMLLAFKLDKLEKKVQK